MSRLPLALLLLLLAPAVAAQAYKWTDAQGTVHYTGTPPPEGTPFTRIIMAGTTPPAPPSPSTRPPAAGDRAPEKTPSAAAMADTPENRAKLCSSLKANIELLNGTGPVVMELHGKQVVLNDTQRAEQTAQAQRQYGQYCSSSP